MITVRVPLRDLLDEPYAIEKKFEDAGIPPLPLRTGFLKRWLDVKEDVCVFEYTPREEAML